MIDSNWNVGSIIEKRLAPLPFTFILSGFLNHVKSTYRFGIGLTVG
jgi:mitochondrial import receptor subunit TOM40